MHPERVVRRDINRMKGLDSFPGHIDKAWVKSSDQPEFARSHCGTRKTDTSIVLGLWGAPASLPDHSRH
jgi:hypothetical protein